MSFVQGGNVFGDRTQGYTFAPPYLYRGMGDEATGITSGVASSAASLLALSPVTGPAAPFIAAAAGLVALFGNIFSGCGNTCIQATQYANQAGSQLDALKAQYFALATPRPYAAQQAYLQALPQLFNWLQQMCGNPALGTAGKNCISQRLTRRPCPGVAPAPVWCDYWSFYYDPVANDPDVAPPPSAAVSSVAAGSPASSSTTASVAGIDLSGILSSPWLIPGALILIGGVALLGSGD